MSDEGVGLNEREARVLDGGVKGPQPTTIR